MKRRLLYVALVIGACGAAVAAPPSGPHRKGEAAVAIRDFVPAYQQFFTRAFTVPRLEAGYERAWYLTATATQDRTDALYEALDEATRRYDQVDLFLLAHANRYIDVVRRLPEEQRAKLRLVYDTGGGSAHRGERWNALGVRTFIGHPGGNIAPLFYVSFLRAWIRDHDADQAMKHANGTVYDLLYGPVGGLASRWMDRDGLWAGTEAVMFRR